MFDATTCRAGAAGNGRAVGKAAAATVLLLACVTATASVGDERVLRDPTRPLRAPAAESVVLAPGRDRPTLSSVLVGAGRRVAVIDGVRMTEGQERQGIRVWEIRADGVVVSVDGSPRLLLEIANSRMQKELR